MDIFSFIKNLPEKFFWPVIVAIPIYILRKYFFPKAVLDLLSLIEDENEQKIVFFCILLIIIGLATYLYRLIYQIIKKRILAKSEEKIIIKKLMDCNNPQKLLLCDFFENQTKGGEISYEYSNPHQNSLNTLVENNIFCCNVPNMSRRSMNGGDIYWINPDIHGLMSKDKRKIYNDIKNSIPSDLFKKPELKETEYVNKEGASIGIPNPSPQPQPE